MKLACVGDGADAGQFVGGADIPDTDEPSGDLDAEQADRERCPLGSRNPNGSSPRPLPCLTRAVSTGACGQCPVGKWVRSIRRPSGAE